jgi:hypothetical protein
MGRDEDGAVARRDSSIGVGHAVGAGAFPMGSFNTAAFRVTARSVSGDGDRVRAGIYNGLARCQNGKWTVSTPEDDLARRVVPQVTISEA